MKTTTIIASLSLLALSSTAYAQSLDQYIAEFINAPGFNMRSSEKLESSDLIEWREYSNFFAPGDAGPIEKAVLFAANSIPSTRTRTAVSYAQILEDDSGAPYPVSFIEVRHFNLGPTIRQDAIEAYGAENTGDLEEFGVGPHRAWRFVFMPIIGASAALIEASAREIPNEEAAKMDCNGIPCLDLMTSPDDLAQWEEVEGSLPEWPRLVADVEGGMASPGHAIAELATLGYWASAESGRYQWTGGEHPEAARGIEPYRFITIDRNLGQEYSIDAVWHETKLNDDAITDLIFRRIDVASNIYYLRASRGR